MGSQSWDFHIWEMQTIKTRLVSERKTFYFLHLLFLWCIPCLLHVSRSVQMLSIVFYTIPCIGCCSHWVFEHSWDSQYMPLEGRDPFILAFLHTIAILRKETICFTWSTIIHVLHAWPKKTTLQRYTRVLQESHGLSMARKSHLNHQWNSVKSSFSKEKEVLLQEKKVGMVSFE